MKLSDVKSKLDKVGCGFCLAKWTQVTMHLHNGMTHSCHHPSPHKIPLKELEKNPTALHNTLHKKRQRRGMLFGKRPEECDYCWNVEDNSDRYSDRILKSSEDWSINEYESIINKRWNENVNPKYVEVSFSNTCNFKCSYCGPLFSSKWMEEVKRYGAYPTNDLFGRIDTLEAKNQIPYKKNEENPYVEAFWKWWPELYEDLHTFRITGGEPLLSKDTWSILDYIIERNNPNRKLNISINSNLGIADSLVDNLIDKIKIILDEKRVNEFILFTSCDGWGKQAEYIRYGLEFNRFWKNITKIVKEIPQITVVIMSTYNAFSPFTYNQLLKNVLELKKEYANDSRFWKHSVHLDTSYLRYPHHQTVQLLYDEHKEIIRNNAEYAYYNSVPVLDSKKIAFTDIEVSKIKRIYDWSNSTISNKILNQERRNLIKFVDEHDRRRGTDFLNTFPQLEKFYYDYK